MQSNIQPIYQQFHSKNDQHTKQKQNINSSKSLNSKLNENCNNTLQNKNINSVANESDCQNDDQLKDTSKIKSSMCLINELARSCKIEHKYILEDEKGLAHKKIFTVRLILGNEEYTMEGSSIKKAQHAAASLAITSTNYNSQPRNKQSRSGTKSSLNKCITPTVELNGLVMKRGLRITYSIIEKPRQVFYPRPDVPAYTNFRQSNLSKLFVVRLNVGVRQYIGQGNTVKAARNHAAEQALHELANLPLTNQTLLSNGDVEKGEINKSVMMLVHEIVHKRKMNIKFEMLRETGPSHLRIYIMQCMSGDLKAEGEGHSKKAAKIKAAENLLPLLLKLPPLESAGVDEKPKKSIKIRKKKSLNKMSSLNPEYGSNMNPSSRLLQIQQAKKEPLPIFKFIDNCADKTDDEQSTRNIGFTVEVTVGDKICNGVGPNKKLAKRVAAEEMLKLLGYYPTPIAPTKPAIKVYSNQPQAVKIPESKVSFSETEEIIKNEDTNKSVKIFKKEIALKYLPADQTKSELIEDGYKSGITTSYRSMLLSVCDKLNIKTQFKEMPKRPEATFLTLLSLSTNPQLHCHGEGATRPESYEAACHMALQSLKEHRFDVDNFI